MLCVHMLMEAALPASSRALFIARGCLEVKNLQTVILCKMIVSKSMVYESESTLHVTEQRSRGKW